MVEAGESKTYFSASQKTQYFAAIAATLGAFALGNVLAWPNYGTNSWVDVKGNSSITESEKDFVGSFPALGALIQAPITGYMIGAVGRKRTMLLLSAPLVGGWLLIAFAKNVGMILAGRIVTGFFAGGFSLAAPVYIGELADSNVRGTLGTGFQLMVVLGISFVYVTGWIGANYQWLSIICAVIPVIFLAAMIFMEESPYWYVMKGRMEEAGKSLAWFRGTSNPSDVQEELNDLKESVRIAQSQTITFKELLHPSILKPTLVSLFLMLFQQLSGINAVIFYVKDIFKSTGSTIDEDVSTNIVGFVQIGATIVSTILIDRLGRRILLITSDVGMAVSLVGLGIFFSLGPDAKDSIGWLPLVCLMIFITAFSLGFGPIPWMILGEILPPRAKGLASSIATLFNWFLAFLVGQFFKPLQEAMGIKWCYFAFAIVCAVGTFYVLTIVPETKGKSLDEIQALFGPAAPSTNYNSNNYNSNGETAGGRDNKSYHPDE